MHNRLARDMLLLLDENWTPKALGANLKAWFDFSDLSTTYQNSGLTIRAQTDADTVNGVQDKSGNNYTATSAAGPTLKLAILNNRSILRFDGVNNYLETADGSSPAISQPSTIFIVGKSTVADGAFFDSKTLAIKHLIDRSSTHAAPYDWRMYAGAAVTSGAANADSKYNVICAQFNGASSFLRVGGYQAATGDAGAAALAGLTLGARGGGTHGTKLTGDIAEAVVVSGAMSSALITVTEQYLGGKWGLNVLGGIWNLIFEGDSLTSGTGSTGRGTYPLQIADTYITTVPLIRMAITNSGTGGATLADMYTDRATIRGLADSTKERNILVIWGGTNDFGGGANEATVETRFSDLLTYHAASGFDKVIAVTMLPRTDVAKPAGFDANRATFNAYIRANAATLGYAVADVAADSRIGDDGDSDDLTYYDADKLHMNNTGYGVVADIVATAIGY